MARSSGGGSRSGGSRSGGSRSGGSSRSHGGSNGRVVSSSPFPNARKFRYYRNGSPVYVYSNVDLRAVPDAKPRWFMILFYLPFVFAVIGMFGSAMQFPQRPLDLVTTAQVAVCDEGDVFSLEEEERLVGVLNDFKNSTGVTAQVVTVDWETWSKGATSFSNYAFYRYYVQFSDENCWLLVYSELDNGLTDWEWEGIQGDNTIDVVDVFIDSFNIDVQSGLMSSHEPDPAETFIQAFSEASGAFDGQRFEVSWEELPMAIFVALFVAFHSYVMIFAGTRKKYSNSELEEVFDGGCNATKYCKYCGGVYTVAVDQRCPNCNSYIGD